MHENELSGIVWDISLKIHKHLGPGLLEKAYETCLVYELAKTGLLIERQKPLPLVYEDVKMTVGYRVDIMIENKLILEVKAVEAVHDIHRAQLLAYLRLSGCRLGILLNFNTALMKNGFQRIVNNLEE